MTSCCSIGLHVAKTLALKKACGGLVFEHQGMCWSGTAWEAGCANLAVDTGQLQHLPLIHWVRKGCQILFPLQLWTHP